MTARTFDVEAALGDDRWIQDLARGLVQDASEAEDALQEARLALLRSPQLRDADPRPWLARVAINFVKKRRREESRRRRRELLVAQKERQLSLPEEAMERLELRRQVLEAVVALEEPYRSTLVLRFFEDLSVREISRAAEVPINTVKTRLLRALGQLRRRLDARHGGKGAWAVLLFPFLAPALRAAVIGGGVVGAQGAAGAGSISMKIANLSLQGGVASMSVKAIAAAVGISGAILLGGFAMIHRSSGVAPDATQSRNAGDGVAARGAPAVSSGLSARAGDARRAAELEKAAKPAPDSSSPDAAKGEDAENSGDAAMAQASPTDSPVGPDALAVREAFQLLKSQYGEGDRKGWRAIGEAIGKLQQLILSGPEGFDEFLALLDEEPDAGFLEALLHNLPLGGGEHRQGILDSQELHEEILARFAESQDPTKQAAFLRFFAYNRSLSASRMDDFLQLARSGAELPVRRIAVDAIASNRDLIADTWQVLANTLEHDADPECRDSAVYGLATADTDGARNLVNAAFTSPDERLRAAALGSAAGDRIPAEVTGGDAGQYLLQQLQEARTPRYKMAILKRLVAKPPEGAVDELRRAMAEESDMGVRKSYRQALEAIEESRGVPSK